MCTSARLLGICIDLASGKLGSPQDEVHGAGVFRQHIHAAERPNTRTAEGK